MLPDIDTLAKLLVNADSPKPANHLQPPARTAITNATVYGPYAGNVLPHGALPGGRVPSELARILREMRAANNPSTEPGAYNG
jgi:hypothetical protein